MGLGYRDSKSAKSALGKRHTSHVPNLIAAELSTREARRLTWFGSTDLIRHSKLHLERLVSSNFMAEARLQVKHRSFHMPNQKHKLSFLAFAPKQ